MVGLDRAGMRWSGRIVGECFQYLRPHIRPGVTTLRLNQLAEDFIKGRGGRPAFKHYNGFPASICVSPNEVVIHGIPGEYRLQEGDIVSIDLGVERAGFFTDAANTYAVGNVSLEKRALINVAQEALAAAVSRVRAGAFLEDIGGAIETVVKGSGFFVVRNFCGHGIGRQLHEKPEVPNFRSENRVLLREGFALAIEPMVNLTSSEVKILSDGWSVVTADGSPSAHCEDTIYILEKGCEVLTRTE